MGVGVEKVDFAWDGTYYELDQCPGGKACAARRTAGPGRYEAELCAVRSTRTIDSIGAPVCVDTGQHACARVLFDFPSAAQVTGTL